MLARIDMRRVARLMLLVAVALCSFGLTLWATAPTTAPSGSGDFHSDVERIASYGISSQTALIEAALSIGYSRSRQMAANVDGMNRINDREVAVQGWLADPGGDA